jgi:hypothetical protein
MTPLDILTVLTLTNKGLEAAAVWRLFFKETRMRPE